VPVIVATFLFGILSLAGCSMTAWYGGATLAAGSVVRRRLSKPAMRALAASVAAAGFAACAATPDRADPRSDAPEARVQAATPRPDPASYQEALRTWRGADDINAWIGAKFEYDPSRAMLLSETQRERNGRVAIIAPRTFFEAPRGICVDLARFAVETLRIVDARAKPKYLMIEFDPAVIGGNVLRRHWVASFEHDGQLYFFADSKRPGHLAGPYRSTEQFVSEYARYRGRRIVSSRLVDSYERRIRALAVGRPRTQNP
jgi:hypothetical protein